jgi:hypothetical protein
MAGGGVGEAMLIGAVTGAGTSAVTGGDPLKGALLGAAGGGIGYGVAGPAATVPGTTGAAPVSQAAAATPGLNPGSLANVAQTQGTLTTAQAGLPEVAGQVGTSVMPSGATMQSTMMPGVDKDISLLAGQGAPTASASGTGIRPSLPTTDDTRQASKYFPNISELYARNPNLFPAAAGAATSAMFGGPKPFEKEDDEYDGPLSDFSYSRSGYTPYRAASGGLMDSAVAKRMMKGGHLGSYSDGGRLLKGPGDGMSDNIPAKIGSKQPARLADGEFVIPADVVSGLGNGSTDAGARRLYAMMDKVRQARTGNKKQGKQINANKYMPA